MNAAIARTLTALALVLVLTILCFYATIFVAAARSRSAASKLLVRVRELRPGQTSEAQAKLLLKPYTAYEEKYSQTEFFGDSSNEASQYAFYNVASWERKLLSKLPMEAAAYLTPLPWTRFSVNLRYHKGILSYMRVGEAQQEHPGDVHPVAAVAEILSMSFEQNEASEEPQDFRGFFVHHQNTQYYDDSHPVGSPCCEEELIVLDERATPQQLSQSLNFDLHCLDAIKPCNTIAAIRPPN